MEWETGEPDISGITAPFIEKMSPDRVDDGLALANTHAATTQDESTETLLLAIISQCQDRPGLIIQHLKAFTALLQRYTKLKQTEEHRGAFENALMALKSTWSTYEWQEESFESFEFIEATLQLTADIFNHGFRGMCKQQFRDAVEKAEDVFGSDDERTLWVLISIGLVYQNKLTWDQAEEWFEAALAAALRNKDWGPKDGIVRSLENAMDCEHFSTVTNEGRPYKTTFGASGLRLMPNRIHLE